MKVTTPTCIALALLCAGLIGTISLHHHNARLRVRVAELRQQRERQEREKEKERPAPIETQVDGDGANEPTPGFRADVAKVRIEIAALEKRAEEQYASHPETTDAPAGNRDPEKGMTRLENLQNVGQFTPAAAFQTLAWAVLKGDDKVMAQVIGLDDVARKKVQELMANLPEAERDKYPTPESLVALFLAKALVNVSAIQIVDTTHKDTLNATITVRGLVGNDQQLPMRLGATGWQLFWEGEKQVAWLRAELIGTTANEIRMGVQNRL